MVFEAVFFRTWCFKNEHKHCMSHMDAAYVRDTQVSSSILIPDFICLFFFYMCYCLKAFFFVFHLVMRFVRKTPVAVTPSFQLQFEVGFGLNYIQILRYFPLCSIAFTQS